LAFVTEGGNNPVLMTASSEKELDLVEVGMGPHRVVFLHGVLDRGRSFDRVVALLAAECRMTWYDRRGYGDSLNATGAPVAIDGHVADLLRVLDGRSAVVVGHSFGGVTALGAALEAPELIDAIVLYETGMAWIPGWDDRTLSAVLSSDDPESDAARLMLGDRFEQMAPSQRAAWLQAARALVAEERSVRTGREPFDVGALQAPLVFGHGDSYAFLAVADHLRQAVPRVQIVRVPGAGHNAHRTHPGPFAELVRLGIRSSGS
jgi:pimeloyl-ACP methyl ester carboxylesterase